MGSRFLREPFRWKIERLVLVGTALGVYVQVLRPLLVV